MIIHPDGRLEGTPEELAEYLRRTRRTRQTDGTPHRDPVPAIPLPATPVIPDPLRPTYPVPWIYPGTWICANEGAIAQ
jgi:hypothetical protein